MNTWIKVIVPSVNRRMFLSLRQTELMGSKIQMSAAVFENRFLLTTSMVVDLCGEALQMSCNGLT